MLLTLHHSDGYITGEEKHPKNIKYSVNKRNETDIVLGRFTLLQKQRICGFKYKNQLMHGGLHGTNLSLQLGVQLLFLCVLQ